MREGKAIGGSFGEEVRHGGVVRDRGRERDEGMKEGTRGGSLL